MSKEYLEALKKFLDDYLTLCEKLHTNRQEKMLLDKNSPYNVLKTYLEAIEEETQQEPKHYLKWEDLEFTNEEQSIQVLLNGKKYTMFYYDDEVCFDTVSIAGVFIDSCSQQFFNDLHLERVE